MYFLLFLNHCNALRPAYHRVPKYALASNEALCSACSVVIYVEIDIFTNMCQPVLQLYLRNLWRF